MAIYASEKGAGGGSKGPRRPGQPKNFIPAPQGPALAVCIDVIDLGFETNQWDGQQRRQHKIRLRWQLQARLPDGSAPYMVQKKYTLSLAPRSALRRDLEAWRGRPFTEAELKKFDVETVIGANCYLNVIHNTKPSGTYADVVTIMPAPKSMPILFPENYIRRKDRPSTGDAEHDQGEANEEHDQRTPDDKPPF